MTRSDFTLDDFLKQMHQVNRLGPLGKVMGVIPGMRETMAHVRIADAEWEACLSRMQAIYDSMTPGERERPEIIAFDRRRRIARGAGIGVNEVSRFLRDFARSREMMRAVGKMGVLGRVRAPFDAAAVLGLVTENRIARDPSYVHWPDGYRRRLLMLIGLIAAAAVVALVCVRIFGRS
jgi:signal recognition particle GTPase